jgi:phage-related protein
MKRKILTYGGFFEAFRKTLTKKEEDKLDYCLLLLKTQNRVPVKFVSLIKDGLYELRFECSGNIFRVFFVFDDDRIIMLFNGFQKKSQKTPTNEIEKALKIKEEYYADKQSQNR